MRDYGLSATPDAKSPGTSTQEHQSSALAGLRNCGRSVAINNVLQLQRSPNRFVQRMLAGARIKADAVPSFILQRQPRQSSPDLPNSLSQYPEDEREKVRIFQQLEKEINSKVDEAFDPNEGGGWSTDADTRVVIADNVVSHKKPLTALAAYLAGNAAVRLGLNETVVVPIAPVGQQVRFTYLMHGKGQKVIVVEGWGSAPAMEPTSGEAKFRAKHFTWGGGWKPGEKKIVYQALTLTPDGVLPDGVKFNRTSGPQNAEAAEFDANTNSIAVFDGGVDSSSSVGTLIHEFGHVADNERTRKAWATYQASQKTPADENAVKHAHDLSGGDMDPGDYGTEFRKAAKKDGITPETSKHPPKNALGKDKTLKGAPTDYGDTNWKELFAESFSIYTTDPRLLEQIRPAIYKYFVGKFPPSAPPAAPAPAPAPAPNRRGN